VAAETGRPWWRRPRTWALAAGAGCATVVAVAAGVYSWFGVPPLKAAADREATVFYYADGRTELGRIGTDNRVSVPLSDVPAHVRDAVLSAEDRDFASNPGVSFTGLARALWVNLRGGALQGGSTITQQYVKNALLTPDRTLRRKVQELVVALKLERDHSKDEILESYLNTIYFGRGAYGIEAAAKAYFNKDVRDLSVSEGAVLAAVINSPVASDPSHGGQDRLGRRWRFVIDGMVKMGRLSPGDAAAQRLPRVLPHRPAVMAGTRGYLIDALRQELKDRGFSDIEIEMFGLRVVTTLDPRLQRRTNEVMGQVLSGGALPGGARAGLVVLEPENSRVVAMYGGRDYLTRPFNNATQVGVPASLPDRVRVPFADIPRLTDLAASETDNGASGTPAVPSMVSQVSYPDGRVLLRDGRVLDRRPADHPAAERAAARIGLLAKLGGIQSDDRVPAAVGSGQTPLSADGRSLAAVVRQRYAFAFSLYREAGNTQVRITGRRRPVPGRGAEPAAHGRCRPRRIGRGGNPTVASAGTRH
jgi:hypothetical protein